VKIFYKVQGELSADNNLPIWFNLIESAPGKPDEYVGKAEVLQLKLAQSPLPESTFSIDENVLRGGYTALIYPTNNLLVVQSSNQHSVDKPIYFMGTLVNPSVVRIILIALMCIVTIAGAVIMLISHKRSNTRSTNQQQTK